MIALSSEIATSAPSRAAPRALLAVQRRDADDLGRDVLERQALAGAGVRAAQREPDRCGGGADAPQLAQLPPQVAPPDRLVEDHRPGRPPREEARGDPARVAREHDDVHARKYSSSRIGQRALRWWRRSA